MKISDSKKLMKAAFLAGDTLIMDGVHGIGKSDVVEQYASETNTYLEELFLSSQEVGDLIGNTNTIDDLDNPDVKVLTWSKPSWLVRMEDFAWPRRFKMEDLVFNDTEFENFIKSSFKNISDIVFTRLQLTTVYLDYYGGTNYDVLMHGQMNVTCNKSRHCALFLDELNRANDEVRQSALQLVLKGQIHEHFLPRVKGYKTLIIAAVNPASVYQVYELDPALIDRFMYVKVDASLDGFIDFCKENNVHDILKNFVIENPELIHWTPKDGGNGSTPRSLVKTSEYIYLHLNGELEDSIMPSIFMGKLGDIVGAKLFAYYQSYKNVITMEDVVTLVEENKNDISDIEELAKLITELMGDSEAEPLRAMASKLCDEYMPKDDILPFLAYLYSLPMEIVNSYLKMLRANDNDVYRKLNEIDDKLNNKKLTRKIVSAAYKEG